MNKIDLVLKTKTFIDLKISMSNKKYNKKSNNKNSDYISFEEVLKKSMQDEKNKSLTYKK